MKLKVYLVALGTYQASEDDLTIFPQDTEDWLPAEQ